MSNVHTPQRLDHEDQDAYRLRREASRRIVRTLTQGPTQAKFKPTEKLLVPVVATGWWTGQHTTNPLRRVIRNANKLLGARQARKVMKAERRAVRAEGTMSERGLSNG